jgi:hypothetical protein
MTLLNWAGEHPILSTVFLLIICVTLHDVALYASRRR